MTIHKIMEEHGYLYVVIRVPLYQIKEKVQKSYIPQIQCSIAFR